MWWKRARWTMLPVLVFLLGCAAGDLDPGARGWAPVVNRDQVYEVMKTTWARVDYDAVPARDVIWDLSLQTGLDFVVVWNEDGYGDGFHSEALVTLQLRQPTPLIDVIDHVLRQVTQESSTWTLGETYVRLGTKEKLNEEKYLVIYPGDRLIDESPVFRDMPEGNRRALKERLGFVVTEDAHGNIRQYYDGEFADLVDSLETAEEIIDILTSIIDPYQWEVAGGSGGDIRYLEGAFLIHASDYLHRQIGEYRFPRAEPLISIDQN